MKRSLVWSRKPSLVSLCLAAIIALMISFPTSGAAACTTYTTPDFCDPSDWIYYGSSPGTVGCVDSETLLISRCNHTVFPFPDPLQGVVEFTCLALPTGDYNTNFSIRLGSSATSMDAVFLGMNETNRWVYHDENGGEHWIGLYSGTWTKVRILINTDVNKWSLWLDDILIAEDIGADFDITSGIDLFQLHSGRNEVPHDSYLKNIEIENCMNEPPDCSGARPSVETIWPPNHKMVEVEILNIIDPDDDPLDIEITAVMQDEPLEDNGDGAFEPDAFIDGDKVQLRAERSGPGDGRVYHVYFTATDEHGAACEGEVLVGVPHSKKVDPLDDGALYDSTGGS